VSELGRLGVRLVLQRAVEEEVDDWLGRARYERRAEAAPGKRNGYPSRRLQTGEGEIVVEVPQMRTPARPSRASSSAGASASWPPSRCRRW
jgi:transposase-like protein